MRIICIFIFYFLLLESNFSQKARLALSEEIKVGQKYQFEGHLHSGENAHFVYFTESGPSGFFGIGDWPVLEKFDSSFNLVFSKPFKLDKKDLRSYGMKYFRGRILWLISELDTKGNNLKFSIIPIELDGRRQRPIPVGKFKYKRKDDRPEVSWAISQDSSKVVFQASVDNNDEKLKMSVYNSVLNESLGTIWSEQAKLDVTEVQYDRLETVLKNDGSVVVLAKVYEGNQAKESKRTENRRSVAGYEIAMITFRPGEADAQMNRLDLGESFIRGAALVSNSQDELKCGGFYSDSRNGAITGVFYLSLGADNTVQAANKRGFSPADLQILGRNNTQRDRDGAIGLEDRFRFSDILLKADGSAIVVAEQNFFQVFQQWNGRFYSNYYQYYSMDIVAFSINSNGEVSAITVIPKYQTAIETDYFLSYTASVSENNAVFFYNEDVDNLRRSVTYPDPRPVSSFNDAVAVMTVLKPNGNLVRRPLFEATDLGSLFIPKVSRAIRPDKLFFVAVKGGMMGGEKLYLGSVTLE